MALAQIPIMLIHSQIPAQKSPQVTSSMALAQIPIMLGAVIAGAMAAQFWKK